MKPARLASSKFARWAGPMWIGCVQSTSPISSPGRTLRVSFHLGRVDKIEEDRRKQQQRQGEWRRCLEPAKPADLDIRELPGEVEGEEVGRAAGYEGCAGDGVGGECRKQQIGADSAARRLIGLAVVQWGHIDQYGEYCAGAAGCMGRCDDCQHRLRQSSSDAEAERALSERSQESEGDAPAEPALLIGHGEHGGFPLFSRLSCRDGNWVATRVASGHPAVALEKPDRKGLPSGKGGRMIRRR